MSAQHTSPSPLAGRLPVWMVGSLAHCQSVEFAANGRPERTCFEDQVIASLRAFIASFPPSTDTRALLSRWQHLYNSTLLPAAVTALVAEGWIGQAPLTRTSLISDPHGHPHRIFITGDRTLAAASRETIEQRWQRFVGGHLIPLHDTLRLTIKAAPRLLWANSVAMVHWVFAELDSHHPGLRPMLTTTRAVLAQSVWSDGTPNPLQVPPPGPLERRVCCLSYLLPGEDLCPTCPLPPHTRKAQCRLA